MKMNTETRYETQAKRLLVHYFRVVFEASGLNFDSDNQVEIEEIIGSIFESIENIK